MKKSHMIGLVVIGIAITLIISTAGDASTYVTFREARDMAEKGSTAHVHVVGELTRDEAGEVTGVMPGEDKVSLSFTMVDDNGEKQRVRYNNPMPTDLLHSEKVVVVGRYAGDAFLAEKILLKCPSKYQEAKPVAAGIEQ